MGTETRATLIILLALGMTVGLCFFMNDHFLSGLEDNDCSRDDCGDLLDLDDEDTVLFD